jgi:Ca2+-transporting ATPase
MDYISLRNQAKTVNQLTFSTERKYMATLVDSSVLNTRVLYVKGAPEIVMGKCNLEESRVKQYNEQLLAYQNQAMRTLGVAYKVIPENSSTDCAELVKEGGLTFMGIFAISDPIRPDVPDAVKKCQSAGIRVKIVTGDTPGTATEIARQIGLWTSEDTERNRITGVEFAALSDEEALERVVDLKVMSRARPMDKQRLVQLLQQKGEVVAVTGDGTNDAPALNHAQVGLSMGTGTSVAKEASDITLLDDSFHSIATAVMWGRSLYKNIQRFIVFQLTINVVALLSVLLGAFLGTELPLTVTQMLWVNLIMDTFAAMALASIAPSMDVMNEKQPTAMCQILISIYISTLCK